MKRFFMAATVMVSIFLWAEAAMSASPGRLPLVQGKKTVALVNGEAITLDELNGTLASRSTAGGRKAGPKETLEVLQRLIDARLAVQEGRKMGLPELPEVRNMVDSFARAALREELGERQVAKVTAPEEEVERLYKDGTREWKLFSIMFEKEGDAKKMVEELEAGKAFEDLAKSAVAAGSAKGGESGYEKTRGLNPEIVSALSKAAPGTVSPIMPIKPGFVLAKLEDVRYVDSPEERQRARQEALKHAKVEALNRYNQGLIKRYVVLHKGVLDGLDLEAKEPGFEQLGKDGRVLAEIRGEKPITVADLAEEVRHRLYHGVEQAAESKDLNKMKTPTLDDMIYKRVFRKEALRLGLDKQPRYRYKVRAYEDSAIFDAFVKKAVVPDVKLGEEEAKAYYQAHIEEYTFPEMVRIRSLAFEKRADAERALEKMRTGTEFQWLSENAEGQVDKKSEGVLTFDGSLIVESDLPEGVRKAISGGKSGDSRLYAAPEGRFYLLSIEEEIPSKAKPYEEARVEIGQKLFEEKLKAAMADWIAKLRAASSIEIYLKEAKGGT
jgi:parvulin-like peptidyl-prolyl isomerase